MQWSNFTACGRSPIQEISYIFMETESSLLCLQNPTLTAVLSRMSPVYTLLPYLLKIHFNIILLSEFEFSKIFVL
jgi:hypothetical protein